MSEMYHQTKMALGSDVTLVLVGDISEVDADAIFANLWSQIYRFERLFSRFIPGSELSQFNASAGMRVPISSEFRELLLVAKQLGRESQGLFNPLILPALQRVGYNKSFVADYANDEAPDYSDRSVGQIDQLTIGDTWAQIPYGCALDVGGFGKGYLADQLADSVAAYELSGYWFSLGGDIAGAGYDEHDEPWEVHIADARHEGATLERSIKTTGSRFGAATSGTTVRRGTGWHHLIDPRTLLPSESDIVMATLYGESALRADVFASCALLAGSRAAHQFLESVGMHDGLLQFDTEELQAFGSSLQQQKVRV